MLMLEQNTSRKKWVDKNAIEMNGGNDNSEYKMKII